jgi:hypothetical protein
MESKGSTMFELPREITAEALLDLEPEELAGKILFILKSA